MSALTWSDAYLLQQPRMDDTHREFVDQLALLESALPERDRQRLQVLLDGFVLHTERHFAQEERWMSDLGFDTDNCHAFQHGHVLDVLREVQRRLREDGDVDTVALLAAELAQWFPVHAKTMDTGLAQTMTECGYDTETGSARRKLADLAVTGGGCGCS